MKGRPGLPSFQLSPDLVIEDQPAYVRFPYDADTAKPVHKTLYRRAGDTTELTRFDTYLNVEVAGTALDAVVTGRRRQSPVGFAITPPVLLDGNGDGKFEFE